MPEPTQKQILLIQIITDLESAKETCDEQGFLGIDEVNRIIDKVKKVKEIDDAEIEKAEKDDVKLSECCEARMIGGVQCESCGSDGKIKKPDDWPEMHGAHDTKDGPEV